MNNPLPHNPNIRIFRTKSFENIVRTSDLYFVLLTLSQTAKIFDCSKLKVFADDIFKFDENGQRVLQMG